MPAPTFGDLVLRTDNSAENRAEANTWADQATLEDLINFRMDADLYQSQDEATKVRAIVSAYRDLDKLQWTTFGISQSRQIVPFEIGYNDAPLNESDFQEIIPKAQVAQIMYILAGTQVRDLAAQGVTLTRALTGVETEIQGYRGPVCAEALEILAPWIEMMPRFKRMR